MPLNWRQGSARLPQRRHSNAPAHSRFSSPSYVKACPTTSLPRMLKRPDRRLFPLHESLKHGHTGAQIICSVWLEGETPVDWTLPERYRSSRARSAHTRREGRPARKAGEAECKGSGVRRRSLVQLPVEKFSPAARVERSWASVLGPAPAIPARSPMATEVTQAASRWPAAPSASARDISCP